MIKNKGMFSLRILAVFFVILLTACDQPAVDNNKNDAILQELKQIRVLLESIDKKSLPAAANRKATPTTVQLSIKNKPSLGKADAPVTIVEVSDYQCPYCKRFVDNTLPQIKKEYIDTGKVRLVFKDLPLSFHKNARKAAQAAHCAGDQNKYWKMHDVLFQNARRLEQEHLFGYAKIIKLDQNKFITCLNSEQHLATIDFDAKQANQVGLTGTPSFVIGKTNESSIKGEVVRGAQPFARIKAVIEKQLQLAK